MSLITDMRLQAAVWWSRSQVPDESGTFSFAAPVQIECRWEDKLMEVLDAQGQKTLSSSTVYVDREMGVGDKLKFGSIDSETMDDPVEDREAFSIIRFEKLPDFSAEETLLTAYL